MSFSINKIVKVNDVLDDLKISQVNNLDNEYYKGIIFDSEDNIIMTNFPHTQEFVIPNDVEKFSNDEKEKKIILCNFGDKRKSYKSYITEEGTLIRVFNHNKKWYISTQSKLNANNSYWSNEYSFGSQFERYILESNELKTMDDFYEVLDINKQYMFLLPTVENNRIGKPLNPNGELKVVYLIGVRDKTTGVFTFADEIEGMQKYWNYLQEVKIKNVDDLTHYIGNKKNIIFYFYEEEKEKKLENFYIVKCLNKEYSYNCTLRNNECNLEYRYFELLLTNPVLLDEFCKLFPNDNYSKIDTNYSLLISYIHSKYINRYVKRGEFEMLPKYIHYIIKTCHKNYKMNRVKTTRPVILGVLLSLKIKFLYYVYKEFLKIL
jgi:hypothetical protein